MIWLPIPAQDMGTKKAGWLIRLHRKNVLVGRQGLWGSVIANVDIDSSKDRLSLDLGARVDVAVRCCYLEGLSGRALRHGQLAFLISRQGDGKDDVRRGQFATDDVFYRGNLAFDCFCVTHFPTHFPPIRAI